MENPIKTGIASYGMSGKVFHGPLLRAHPGFKVTKVLERSKKNSAQLFPDAEITKDFESLLKDVELVIVNTPDHLHYSMARSALEAGKHVVVEKPLVLNSAEGSELLDLANQKGCLLSVFQNRRWDGDFMTVQQVVAQELLGELVSYEAHYDRYRNYIQPNTWKEAAGLGSILFNLGAHLIDQALVLFGLPDSVTASKGIQRNAGKVDDFFDLWLDYPGLRATLKASYMVRQPGPRFQLHGSEGSFALWGTDPQEDALKAGQLPGSAGWGEVSANDWGQLTTSLYGLEFHGQLKTLPGNYLAFYNKLFESIRKGGKLPVTAEEGLQVIKIIEAATKSHSQGKTIFQKDFR